MTRIVYLPDEKTVIVTESTVPAWRLAEGFNRGTIRLGLPVGSSSGGRLHALASGSLVVVLAGEMLAGAEAGSPTPELNWRMRQVLQGLAEGLDAKQLAAQLGISTRTVYVYIARLKAALGAETRAQIVRQGIARGILNFGS